MPLNAIKCQQINGQLLVLFFFCRSNRVNVQDPCYEQNKKNNKLLNLFAVFLGPIIPRFGASYVKLSLIHWSSSMHKPPTILNHSALCTLPFTLLLACLFGRLVEADVEIWQIIRKLKLFVRFFLIIFN